MWLIIGIVLTGIIISFFEIPPLVKKKWWREMMVYFLFVSTGITLAFLGSRGVSIPSPIKWITKFLSPVTAFFERNLS
jgi:hypothetical protein